MKFERKENCSHRCLIIGARVINLLRHQDQPSNLISSFQGNNEVAIWNIDKPQYRQKVFWPSIVAPLSLTEVRTIFFIPLQINLFEFSLVEKSLYCRNVSLEK